MKTTTIAMCLVFGLTIRLSAQKNADAVPEIKYDVSREALKRIVTKDFSYFTFGDRNIAGLNSFTTVNFLTPTASINYSQLLGKDTKAYGGFSVEGKAGTTDNFITLFNGGKPNLTVEGTVRGFILIQNKHYFQERDKALLDSTINATKAFFAQDTSRSKLEEKDSIAHLENNFNWVTKEYLWINAYANIKQQKLSFIDTTRGLGNEVLDTNSLTGSIGITVNRYFNSEYNSLAKLLSCFWQFDMGLEYGNNIASLKTIDYQVIQTVDTVINGAHLSKTISDSKVNGYYLNQFQKFFTFKYKFDFYKILNEKKTFVFHAFAEGRHSWYNGIDPFFNFNLGIGAAINIPNKSNTKNNISFEPYYSYKFTNKKHGTKSSSFFGVQMNIPFSIIPDR